MITIFFLFKGNIDGPFENFSHVLLRIFDTEDFSESLELFLEVSIGGEAEIESAGAGRFEQVRGGAR